MPEDKIANIFEDSLGRPDKTEITENRKGEDPDKVKHMKAKRITTYLLTLAMLLCLAGCKEEKPNTNRPNMDALRAAEVGSYIYFGAYEQDNDKATGKEAVEWLVLDKQEDKMLVISRYGLDCKPYNMEGGGGTWETSSLREWLNGEFYKTAFISEEKNVILTSVVTADNPMYDTIAGNDTTDKVFLLSKDEASLYFTDTGAEKCIGTPYCFARGARKNNDDDTCGWWLRSLGHYNNSAAYVKTSDDYDIAFAKHSAPYAVRPAMWIDLKP